MRWATSGREMVRPWRTLRSIGIRYVPVTGPLVSRAVGVLSGSPGLDATIAAYASGAVDPRPLVSVTVGLEQVGAVLAGERPEAAGPGPKIHVDPLLS